MEEPEEYEPDFQEDNAFLNAVDQGYIGLSKPQVKIHRLTPQERLEAIQERQSWREADRDTRLDLDWE